MGKPKSYLRVITIQCWKCLELASGVISVKGNKIAELLSINCPCGNKIKIKKYAHTKNSK